MNKLPTLKPKQILLYLTVFVWILWVIVHYLGYRPNHLALFYNHPYSTYLASLGVLILGVGGGSYYRLKKKKKWTLDLRPWWLILLTLTIGATILIAFRQSNNILITPTPTAILFFFFHSLSYLGGLLLIGLSMAGLGNIVCSRLPLTKPSSVLSLAIGFSLMAFYSVILGTAGILSTWTLWPAFIAIIFFQRKYIWEILQSWLINKYKWRVWHWWEPTVALLAMLVVAMFWLGSLKAFPVGFDGAALYANLSHLTASQHVLPAAYQSFGWSVVMSWGELLYGSITMNLLLSHFMYLPAAVLLYQIFRLWLKPSYTLLALVLTFSIPMWSFHAMADEKIDLGFLLICLSIVYLLIDIFSWKKKKHEGKFWTNPFMMALLLVGWLSGFAFSIKYTAILLLAAWVGMYFYYLGRVRLLVFWLFSFLGFIFISGFHSWGNIPLESNTEGQIIGAVFLLIGFAFLTSVLMHNRTWLRQGVLGLVLAGLGFGLAYSPWAVKHLAENDYNLGVNTILFGNPPEVPLVVPRNLLSYERRNNKSPRDYQVLLSSRQEGTAGNEASREEQRKQRQAARAEKLPEGIKQFDVSREEIQRYIGYEDGIFRYTSIPFDLTFDQNVRQVRHKDLGFFYLALFPLLLLALAMSKRPWIRNSLVAVVTIAWLASSFWSLTGATADVYTSEVQVHNQKYVDAFLPGGPAALQEVMFAIQSPLHTIAKGGSGLFKAISAWPTWINIFLLAGVLAGLAMGLRHRWKQWPMPLRYGMIFTFSFFAYWYFLGNAIVWYALPAFSILGGLFLYYWQEKKLLWGDVSAKAVEYLFGTVIVVQLGLNVLILFSTNMPGQSVNKLFNWPMMEYVSQQDMQKSEALGMFSTYYKDISQRVNATPEAKVLRINTYLQFHIEDNNNRVLEDNQLNAFKRVTDRLKDPAQFVDVLKANGFEYVLYDVNSPTIDETPEQSLREKCREFLKVMFAHPDVEVLVTDNFVSDSSLPNPVRLPNGQMAKAKPGVVGETVYRGSIILFGIK